MKVQFPDPLSFYREMMVPIGWPKYEHQPEANGALKYNGSVAEGYDAKRVSQEKWQNENRIIEDWLWDLPIGTAVLDCPVGTGRFIPLYEELGFHVLGLDISEDMLKQAASKVKGENVYCRLGDVRELDLADSSYDVAMCIRLFRWLEPEDVKKALRELQRVARDRVIFNIRLGPENHPKRHYLTTVLDNLLEGWKIHRQEQIVEGFWMYELRSL